MNDDEDIQNVSSYSELKLLSDNVASNVLSYYALYALIGPNSYKVPQFKELTDRIVALLKSSGYRLVSN